MNHGGINARESHPPFKLIGPTFDSEELPRPTKRTRAHKPPKSLTKLVFTTWYPKLFYEAFVFAEGAEFDVENVDLFSRDPMKGEEITSPFPTLDSATQKQRS